MATLSFQDAPVAKPGTARGAVHDAIATLDAVKADLSQVLPAGLDLSTIDLAGYCGWSDKQQQEAAQRTLQHYQNVFASTDSALCRGYRETFGQTFALLEAYRLLFLKLVTNGAAEQGAADAAESTGQDSRGMGATRAAITRTETKNATSESVRTTAGMTVEVSDAITTADADQTPSTGPTVKNLGNGGVAEIGEKRTLDKPGVSESVTVESPTTGGDQHVTAESTDKSESILAGAGRTSSAETSITVIHRQTGNEVVPPADEGERRSSHEPGSMLSATEAVASEAGKEVVTESMEKKPTPPSELACREWIVKIVDERLAPIKAALDELRALMQVPGPGARPEDSRVEPKSATPE